MFKIYNRPKILQVTLQFIPIFIGACSTNRALKPAVIVKVAKLLVTVITVVFEVSLSLMTIPIVVGPVVVPMKYDSAANGVVLSNRAKGIDVVLVVGVLVKIESLH